MKNADLRGDFGAHHNNMRQLLGGFPPRSGSLVYLSNDVDGGQV
jgi:hypothetical protein